METSTLITIIYFCVNIVLLLILSFYIMKTGEHSDVKSLGQDVWAQKKIYAPIIVHFYDSATDIGVVYYWSKLWKDEQNGIDYESVDMEIFFWCGIAFLLLYRVMLFVSLLGMVCHNSDDVEWYDPLLVLVEMYVFRPVYLSHRDAQKTIKDRQKRKQSAAQSPSEAGRSSTANVPETEIKVHDMQETVLIAESVTESLPQIMLQSVFIIRSYNDERLREGSNIWLLLISVFASLLSITDKYVRADAASSERGKSPKLHDVEESLWYVTRALWRLSHIMSTFTVYVLIWTVMGGAFLPIYVGTTYMIYVFLMVWSGDIDEWIGIFLLSLVMLGGAILDFGKVFHFTKCGLVVFGLSVVAIFAATTFECGMCAEAAQRQFDNEDHMGVKNYRISIFYVVGCIAFLVECSLLAIMDRKDIVSV